MQLQYHKHCPALEVVTSPNATVITDAHLSFWLLPVQTGSGETGQHNNTIVCADRSEPEPSVITPLKEEKQLRHPPGKL